MTNIHGLSRYIPEDIRRQVRQECGFGCVICGYAIAQYEHIDPPFAEARVHDPQKIALLCGACHDRITRGAWSKDKVLEARKTPITFIKGHAKDAFDFKDPFDLFIGDSKFHDIHCVIQKNNGDEWFTIEPAESPDAPPRISAKFYGVGGEPELEICENEWYCSTGVWDLKTSGATIEVRNGGGRGQVRLRLKAKPPHGLEILQLNMMFHDTGIIVKPGGEVILWMDGTEIRMGASDIVGANAVFRLP